MNPRNQLSLKVGAAVTLVGLGGLAGFALGDNRGGSTSAALKHPPVQVRTQVIRHTIRIHRKPKPVKHPARPASPPPAAPAPVVAAAAPPQPAVAPRPVAPVRTQTPVRTRTSGAGGGGEREHEHEHEGGDD